MSNVKLIGIMRPAAPRLELPCPDVLARCGIAGFASPAEDYAGRALDLKGGVMLMEIGDRGSEQLSLLGTQQSDAQPAG